MAKTYKNIPVDEETYAHVQLIAEMNNRGLGGQVKDWVDRELPECEHKKVPVSIETFPGTTTLMQPTHKLGFYCQTCKRVYARVSDPHPSPLPTGRGSREGA